MKSRSVIQKFLAFGLLLFFTFSITPKRYLHDLIADHQDTYSFHLGDEASVYQTGLNCQCENLVVSTPFIEATFEYNLSLFIYYSELTFSFNHSCFLNTCSTKDSRGPPTAA